MKIYCCFYDANRKYIKILGLKIYDKKITPDEIKTKYFCVLYKIKSNSYIKYYIARIPIYCKEQFTNKFKQIKMLIESLREDFEAKASIVKTHSEVFPKYRDIYRNKDVAIIGTGPTLNYYNPLKDVIHISLNRAFKYSSNIKFDYAFLSHYDEKTSAQYINELKNYKCKKFFGIYYESRIDFMNIPYLTAKNIQAERYYINSNKNCSFKFDITTNALKNGGSVSFAALQFALWTNPRRIYIVGCDTNMSGYAYSDVLQKEWWGLNESLKTYPMIKNFAKIYYPNIEIISINPVGLRGVFQDAYTEQYLNDNPSILGSNKMILGKDLLL